MEAVGGQRSEHSPPGASRLLLGGLVEARRKVAGRVPPFEGDPSLTP